MVDRAKKISELTAANTVANTDLFVVVANAAGTGVTKTANLSVLVTTMGPLFTLGALSRTTNTGVVYSVNGVTYSTASFTWNGNTVYLAATGANSYISMGNTTVNVYANTSMLCLSGAMLFSGSANTRVGVNTQIGSAGSNGTVYLSTAGKMYLKVANTGVANDDWQRVTTTSVD